MTRLMSIVLGLLIAGNAFAYKSDLMSCEKSDSQKKAALKLLEQFKAGQNLAAVEVANFSITNVGENRCSFNWAYTTLGLNPRNDESMVTCGVSVNFSSQADLDQFAKFAMMLNANSMSSVSIVVKGGFSSRDPHDPYGNEHTVVRNVPFCGGIIE